MRQSKAEWIIAVVILLGLGAIAAALSAPVVVGRWFARDVHETERVKSLLNVAVNLTKGAILTHPWLYDVSYGFWNH